MKRFQKMLAAVLTALLILVPVTASAAAATLVIPGTVTANGGSAPVFPFILTQSDSAGVPVADGVKITADVAVGGQFSFSLPDLTNGTYYFRLEEDVSKAPAGWTYDGSSYVVKVIVADGAASVSGWYSAADFESSVHLADETQTVTLETEGGGISVSGNYHEEGEGGLLCYIHQSHNPLQSPARSPMHYRQIINDDPDNANAQVAIPVTYCLDYFNTVTETGEGADEFTHPYSPSFDMADFEARFPNAYRQVLWLVRHGFTSGTPGKIHGDSTWNAFGTPGTDNNLMDMPQYTGMQAQEITELQNVSGADGSGTDGVLSEEEAYSATQLAIWHFTSFYNYPLTGINWVLHVDGDGPRNPADINHCVAPEFEDIYKAQLALIDAANAAAAAPETETSITRVSAPVRFDFSAAGYINGIYGPVFPYVEDVYGNLGGTVPSITVNAPGLGPAALFADAGATQPLAGPLPAKAGFYAKFSAMPAADTTFASATALVNTDSATMEPVRELYLMKDGTGDWSAAQAVMGLGRAFPSITASASLAGYDNSHPFTDPVAFVNTYTAPTQPHTPEDRGPGSPQTGDDSNILTWVFAGVFALAGLGICGGMPRRKPSCNTDSE